jgi:ATP-binding cassette, subfamily B, bacterial
VSADGLDADARGGSEIDGAAVRVAARSSERRALRLSMFRGRWYWSGSAVWILWFLYPLLPGWLAARFFDELQVGASGGTLALLLVALVTVEAVASAVLLVGHATYMQGFVASISLARVNVLGAQVASGGATSGPRRRSTGDAAARLRDDPTDVLLLLDNWLDLAGSLLYAVGAAVILAAIDPWAAAVGIAPLLLIGMANSRIGHRVRELRQDARGATSDVSGFLNAVFEASLTVKVAGAQRDVLRRLDELNGRRGGAMAREQVWTDALFTVNGTLTDVCVGLALLVAARGTLDAGDVALFASYMFNLVWLPQRIGGVIVGRRRSDVSARRLDALTAPGSTTVDHLTTHRDLPILDGPPSPTPPSPRRQRLEQLELRGVTIAARGVHGVDLVVRRGTLTVVAGPVGSGKSSLLRGLIGLLPLDAGVVLWNGEVVEDRAAFFVPPQCAYVAQVPRLFADTLADNIRLGRDLDDDSVAAALTLAAFASDVAELSEGLATRIGARGVRLSGGQAQRAATTRAVVHAPELLVLDDTSSALDAETESVLWDQLAAAGFTVIAASNRPVALARADQVVRL